MTNRKVLDMRPITYTFVLLLLAGTIVSAQQLRLTRPGYTVSISGASAPERSSLPLVLGRLDTLAAQHTEKRFGILYRALGGASSSFAALDISDASTGTTILSLSAEDVAGSAVKDAERLPGRSFSNDSMRVDAYQVRKDGTSFVLLHTRQRVTDSTYPRGTVLRVAWSIESASSRAIRTTFRAVIEGASQVNGKALIVRPDPSSTLYSPALVISGGASTTLDLAQRSASSVRTATFQGNTVSLTPDQPTTIFSLLITGTTVTGLENIQEQSSLLAARSAGAGVSPRMITQTTVDKPVATAGDTLTFSILFHNIGTAPAVDVVLTNPIDDGLRYLAGSAEGSGSAITFDQSTPEPPQAPVVQAITWTFTTNILPGEERWVSFKAIVQ